MGRILSVDVHIHGEVCACTGGNVCVRVSSKLMGNDPFVGFKLKQIKNKYCARQCNSRIEVLKLNHAANTLVGLRREGY